MHSYLIAASAVALTLGTVAISDRPAPPPVDVQSIISRVAVTYDINPAIIKAVAYQESRFDNGVCSKVGACGVMQLMPATAAEFGAVDRSNPVANIDVGTRHLVKMMKAFDGNLGLANALISLCVDALLLATGVPDIPAAGAAFAAGAVIGGGVAGSCKA
jgi:soluble lytic murein transglycosylase-like protein